MTESTDLTKLGDIGSMITGDRPAGKDEGHLGTEGITQDDILVPRIGVAQKMSPEIDPTSPKMIENLKFMDLFNSLSKQVYGQGPIHFVILRRYDPRWVEFIPLEEGGGIKDRNVPADDPRTAFGPDGEKPIATMFYDFLVLILNGLDPSSPVENVAALSLKSSGIKAAKHLNMLITQRGQKLLCKGVYEMRTGHEIDKKTQGVYAIYKFKNAGWLKSDSALERMALEMFDAWKERDVKIDLDEKGTDDFDAERLEREAVQAEAANM